MSMVTLHILGKRAAKSILMKVLTNRLKRKRNTQAHLPPTFPHKKMKKTYKKSVKNAPNSGNIVLAS